MKIGVFHHHLIGLPINLNICWVFFSRSCQLHSILRMCGQIQERLFSTIEIIRWRGEIGTLVQFLHIKTSFVHFCSPLIVL